MDNKYIEYLSLHKYTKVARGHYRVEVKSMIDLMQVKKDMLRYVQEGKEIFQITMLYCVKSVGW